MVGILIGIIFLHEIPSVWGIVGIVLIIYGSYFVLDTMKERFSWNLLRNKEIQYRIGAMILTAIEAVFIKKGHSLFLYYSIFHLLVLVWSFLLFCAFCSSSKFVLQKK